jgi:hypothetical protein
MSCLSGCILIWMSGYDSLKLLVCVALVGGCWFLFLPTVVLEVGYSLFCELAWIIVGRAALVGKSVGHCRHQ